MTSMTSILARQTATPGDRLTDLPAFGANPGALRARTYVPQGLAPGAPLVVVLHGCTQTAAGYDRGSGWSTLADRAGFALLFPEQQRANNPNLCFNWFSPADIARNGGEAESIAQMLQTVATRHAIDPARVFVTGLSAGGAMTAVMLATWPELFAGGAIIGGLPYRCAGGVPEALARMRGDGGADDAGLVAAVRNASPHPGPWPRVSLWHGGADTTVSPLNMDRLGEQWRGVHGVTGAPSTTAGPGWTRRAWRGPNGQAVVEEWVLAGMGHGVPIDPDGPDALGASGPHMLDIGVSSTAAIARGWGLIGAEAMPLPRPRRTAPPPIAGLQHTIEGALRAAGLMR